jgi:hypothetical protein
MAYIGNPISIGNLSSQYLNGGASSYSLNHSVGSDPSILVAIDGVLQQPSVAYTVSGSTLTFPGGNTTSGTNNICVVYLALPISLPTPGDGTVDSSTIVAGAVDDSHISGMAASKLTGTIADARFPATLPAASGVNLTALNASNLGSGTVPTARLGSGTASSSTFLRGDSTYAEAGGGAWTLIGSQAASSSASLTQTGLNSDYDHYAIVFSDLKPATDSVELWLRVGDSGGIDVGSSDYTWRMDNKGIDNTTFAAANEHNSTKMKIHLSVGNAADEGTCGIVYLGRPADGTTYPMIHGDTIARDPSGNVHGGHFIGARKAVITLDRVQILFSSGNIDSGRFSVFGIKHT